MKRTTWFLFAAVLVFAAPERLRAQTNAIASGDWGSPSTWDNGEPASENGAVINGGSTVTLNQSGETTDLVDLGTVAGEVGTLNMTGGDLFVVNGTGPDTFPSSIRVGQAEGSEGVFNMSGGTVFIDGATPSAFAIGDLLVGDVGTGTLNLSGGTLLAGHEVFLGLQIGSSGTANVSGGTLEVVGQNLLVGWNGEANLNISGTGRVVSPSFLFAGFFAESTPTITQTGGTLDVGAAIILGRRSAATFDHSAGAVTAEGFVISDNFRLNLDESPYTPSPTNADSVYNISGTATTDVANLTQIGAFAGANGTINQTGGTYNTGGIFIGRDGVGTWNISGGSLNQVGFVSDNPENNNFIVGRNGFSQDFAAEGTGVVDQSGGAVSVATNVFVGDFNSSDGTYRISGGTLTVAGDFSVGAALASNAPSDSERTEPADEEDAQGQALDASGTLVVTGAGATIDIGGDFLANPADKSPLRSGVDRDNSALLVFEIDSAAGSSLIDVAGVADLDGAEIDLDLLGGFSPTIGQTFDLLTASSFGSTGSGTTQNVGTGEGFTLAAEDAGLFDLMVVAGGNGEILRATVLAVAGLPGDFNDDGLVDAADYTVYRDNLGQPSGVLNGNGSGAGTVVEADRDLWAANYGRTNASGAAVPEPAAGVIATVMLAATTRVRRR